MHNPPPLVSLGRVVLTPGARDLLLVAGRTPWDLLRRHEAGDWGEVSAEDAEANARALVEGTRILSSYRLGPGDDLWVVTEADRSVTTLLLPDEY